MYLKLLTQVYKLADFGFTKKRKQVTGTTLGSYPYMSPQVLSGKDYGYEVDMWAFGVVFFFMLNMDYPFRKYWS